MDWIARAWADTLSQLGRKSGIYLIVASPLLGLLANYILFGWADTVNELNAFIAAFAGFSLTALLLFAWNFLATPYRMERDRANGSASRILETEKTLLLLGEKVAKLEDRRARLDIEFKGMMFGGKLPEEPTIAPFSVFAYLKNIGELSSVATDWHLRFEKEDGTIFEIMPTLMHEVRMNGVILRPQDFLYEKTLQPIPGGGLVAGYVFTKMDRALQESSARVQLRCRQIDGRFVESEWHPIEGNEPTGALPMYQPGMGDPFKWEAKAIDESD